jgi:hypothetical protein
MLRQRDGSTISTVKESGRRRGCPRRPPTPPGIRFRTKAVPVKPLCFLPHCLSSYKAPSLTSRIPSVTSGFKALFRGICSRRSEIRLLSGVTGSVLRWMVRPTLTTSADFFQPIPSPYSDSSTRQVGRSPRVRRATFIPYTRRIYFYIFRVIIGR